ncbi:MAG: hypothetical protein ACREJB_16530 [Planctomycetaceae bacterium]
MVPIEIYAHLRQEPFQPIRIHLADGSSYEVRHRRNALVTLSDVAVAIETDGGDELPERLVWCDPMHVTRIEPLTENEKKAPRKRKQ